MTLQLLVSTMHQPDYSLLSRMKINSDAVVINQCDRENRTTIEHNGYSVLWIDTTERGLSRSRNMAIRNAKADICMLADDDMEYRDDYVNTVLSAYKRINADIICFQMCDIEKKSKVYASDEFYLSFLKSMKVTSGEISFKRTNLVNKKIVFDELIGAGTEFLMGEENAVLVQCLRNKLRAYYIPTVIADRHVEESTWFTGRNERFFIGKGAAFTAMHTPFTTLLIWQWAFRKRKLYKDKMSMFRAIKYMQKGKKMYKKRANERL